MKTKELKYPFLGGVTILVQIPQKNMTDIHDDLPIHNVDVIITNDINSPYKPGGNII